MKLYLENLTALRAIPINVNVYYENSKLDGTIALGKYDETFVASTVELKNGNGPMTVYQADEDENGEVVLEKLIKCRSPEQKINR